jgi:AraC-like DNA-binding protein
MLGSRTRQQVVRVDEGDARPWIQKAPVCGALAQHRIAHVGVCATRAPYRIVRVKQSGAYFMACFAGQGRILVDGRWQICRAGMACLLPPGTLNAFYASQHETWGFTWVRYRAEPELKPIVTVSSPVLAKFNAEPLRAAVLGLHAECAAEVQPSSVHHWVELIQGYVRRFASPWTMDERLSRLWEKVAAQLDHEWTLPELAGLAHVSGEHLRRLCMQQLGRTPMRQVTYLRMRRAAELLSTTDEKIESITHAVGYQNPFVFSNTFKKWIGWRPSAHRAGAPPPH